MHKEELKEVVGQLRKKRVRITPQRVAMLEFLASVHASNGRRNLQGVDKRGSTSECGNCLQ